MSNDENAVRPSGPNPDGYIAAMVIYVIGAVVATTILVTVSAPLWQVMLAVAAGVTGIVLAARMLRERHR